MTSASAARGLVLAIAASLALTASASAQSSVVVYGGTGGVVETIPGPPPAAPASTPPVTQPPPGQGSVPTSTTPTVPGQVIVPVSDPPAVQPVPEAPSRGLLSLPQTGLTLSLVFAAGLLLLGVGLATRRLATPIRA